MEIAQNRGWTIQIPYHKYFFYKKKWQWHAYVICIIIKIKIKFRKCLIRKRLAKWKDIIEWARKDVNLFKVFFHLCIFYINFFFRGEWYYLSTTTELWSKYWWDWNSGKISFFKANNTNKIKYRTFIKRTGCPEETIHNS